MFDVLTNSRYLSLSMYQYIYILYMSYMLMRVTKKEQIKHTCTMKTCMKEMKRGNRPRKAGWNCLRLEFSSCNPGQGGDFLTQWPLLRWQGLLPALCPSWVEGLASLADGLGRRGSEGSARLQCGWGGKMCATSRKFKRIVDGCD